MVDCLVWASGVIDCLVVRHISACTIPLHVRLHTYTDWDGIHLGVVAAVSKLISGSGDKQGMKFYE